VLKQKSKQAKNLKSIDLIHAVREPAPAHKDVRVLLFLISYAPGFPHEVSHECGDTSIPHES